MKENSFAPCRRTFAGLDILRFVMSLLVVALHLRPLYGSPADKYLTQYLTRIAVPVFFTISGFLFQNRYYLNHTYQLPKIKHYVFHLLRLYLIWSLIYLPWDIPEILEDPALSDAVQQYVRRFFVSSVYIQLWYLNALLWIVLVFLLLHFLRVRPAGIFILSLILYVIGFMGQTCYPLWKDISLLHPAAELRRLYLDNFFTFRNGLFFGLALFVLGTFLAEIYPKISLKSAAAGFLISFILLGAECYFTGFQRHDINLMLLPASFFLTAAGCNLTLHETSVTALLRKMSLLIFLLHEWIYNLILRLPVPSCFTENRLAVYFAVLSLTILSSWFLLKLKNRSSIPGKML